MRNPFELNLEWTLEEERSLRYLLSEKKKVEGNLAQHITCMDMHKNRFFLYNNIQDKQMELMYEGNIPGIRERLKAIEERVESMITNKMEEVPELFIWCLPFKKDESITVLEMQKSEVKEMMDMSRMPYFFHGATGLASLVVYGLKTDLKALEKALLHKGITCFDYDNANHFASLEENEGETMNIPTTVVMYDPYMDRVVSSMLPALTQFKEIDGSYYYDDYNIVAIAHPFMHLMLEKCPQTWDMWVENCKENKHYNRNYKTNALTLGLGV